MIAGGVEDGPAFLCLQKEEPVHAVLLIKTLDGLIHQEEGEFYTDLDEYIIRFEDGSARHFPKRNVVWLDVDYLE